MTCRTIFLLLMPLLFSIPAYSVELGSEKAVFTNIKYSLEQGDKNNDASEYKDAIEIGQEFIKTYPKSKYNPEVRRIIRLAQKGLANVPKKQGLIDAKKRAQKYEMFFSHFNSDEDINFNAQWLSQTKHKTIIGKVEKVVSPDDKSQYMFRLLDGNGNHHFVSWMLKILPSWKPDTKTAALLNGITKKGKKSQYKCPKDSKNHRKCEYKYKNQTTLMTYKPSKSFWSEEKGTFRLRNGGTNQLLQEPIYGPAFIGDLDGDSKIDLLAVGAPHTCGSTKFWLYLSGKAEKGKLLKKVGEFIEQCP